MDNNFVRNKTLTEIESEESLSHKTKKVELLKNLIFTLGKVQDYD